MDFFIQRLDTSACNAIPEMKALKGWINYLGLLLRLSISDTILPAISQQQFCSKEFSVFNAIVPYSS